MKGKQFYAAMYLRLSRDDEDRDIKAGKTGLTKTESNSIGSQRELIKSFLREQPDTELYDIYVDGSAKIGLNQIEPYSKGGR